MAWMTRSEEEQSMANWLDQLGFLGTKAPMRSDITLVLILITAISFTLGWRLAVKKQYEVHRWVQTITAMLNACVVVLAMISVYIVYILPGIPAKLLQGDYAVSTIHAIVGGIGLLLGIFVVLRANRLVPRCLRFKNYKLFMRTSYALYMLATALGVAVYSLVYIFGI
jgi:uncharacterized membrane protein YozB (DUF420 family)